MQRISANVLRRDQKREFFMFEMKVRRGAEAYKTLTRENSYVFQREFSSLFFGLYKLCDIMMMNEITGCAHIRENSLVEKRELKLRSSRKKQVVHSSLPQSNQIQIEFDEAYNNAHE